MRLAEYIRRHTGMDVFICTEEEELKQTLMNESPFILFREQGFAESVVFHGKEVMFTKDKEQKGIYMYQDLSCLFREITEYEPEEQTGETLFTEMDGTLHLVYSPLGRCGKTSFALALSKASSFFYLGMEEYGIEGNKEHTMDEILYYIRNRKEEIDTLLWDCSEEWKGVRMLASPFCFSDLKILTMEDYRWFFEKLRAVEERKEHSMVVDLGTGCLPGYEFFGLFDRIYIPILSGEREEKKIQNFREIYTEVYGEKDERCRLIQVPDLSWEDPEFMEKVREGMIV